MPPTCLCSSRHSTAGSSRRLHSPTAARNTCCSPLGRLVAAAPHPNRLQLTLPPCPQLTAGRGFLKQPVPPELFGSILAHYDAHKATGRVDEQVAGVAMRGTPALIAPLIVSWQRQNLFAGVRCLSTIFGCKLSPSVVFPF